jgi:PAS domain S-box-containing protein
MDPLINHADENIHHSIEQAYQKYLVNVCMVIALPALSFFMIHDIFTGNYVVGIILLSMLATILGLFFLTRNQNYKTRESQIYQYFLTSLFVFFGLYLIYAIGINGDLSRTPWAYIFPVMVFFALGAGRAFIWVSILICILAALEFLFPSRESIAIGDLKLRFYISFVLVIIASYFFERLKKNYQQELIDNQRTLKESEVRYRKAYEQLDNEMNERRRAEDAWRESEEYYRVLVEDMPALICRFLPDGTLTFVNNSYCQYFKKSRKDLIGANFFQFIPEPERETVLNHFKSLTVDNPAISYEHQVILTGGEVRWQRWTDHALFDDGGKLYQYQSVGIDITESKQKENALQESEERFRELAELMPETIFEADLKGDLTFVNRKAYSHFGYTEADFERGLNAFDMIIPRDRERAIENLRSILRGETIGLSEYTAQRKDGSRFPVLIHSAAIVRNGKTCGIRGFIIDHTERKQSEEEKQKLEVQFQQAQRLETIGTLAGGIAHDFNNLLMTIQGNTSLILFDIDISHPHHDSLKNIEKQIERGAKLTKQLLGYARKGKYNVKPINLNQILRESSETFGRTRKEIRITHELEPDLFTIEADQGQIEQILYNLYVNAADAMPGGGKLVLKTNNVTHEDIKSEQYDPVPGNYVRLTVADTGTGIAPAVKERIFDPFFTTKETGRGTGLGLASVYGITKSHDGYIEVETQQDQGCTFNIYLPASGKEAFDPPEVRPYIYEGSGNILLVDDEEMVLDVAGKVLEKMGYTVFEAQSGKKAVEIFKQNKDTFDLVVLDIIMPDMGGGEVFDRIKEINPQVKVLLSSGYSIDGQATEIMKRGCDGFIQKPFKANALSETIKEILTKE